MKAPEIKHYINWLGRVEYQLVALRCRPRL